MLPFTSASEPVNVLVETLQWKVSQCVAADFLGFVPVQMLSFSTASEPVNVLV